MGACAILPAVPASCPFSLRRRQLLAGAGLTAAGCGTAGLLNTPVSAAPAAAVPRGPASASGFRLPGEFEPQAAIWLGHDPNLEDITVELIRALAPHVALKMMVATEEAAQRVRAVLEHRGLAAVPLRLYVDTLAVYYPRDAAVFALGTRPASRLGVVDFGWNDYGWPAWCRRRHADAPNQIRECQAAADFRHEALDRRFAALTGAALVHSPLVLEGGGVESNGQGLLIACEALLRSRNPGLSRAQLDRLHRGLPGVQKVIWMPEGLAQDPHLRATITGPYVAWGTGGHTDEFVRFASPDTVLLAWPDEDEAERHPVARLNRVRMQRNAAVLSAARTVQGRPLRVLTVPMPRIIEQARVLNANADRQRFDAWTADFFPRHEGRRDGDTVQQVATATYLNFVIANGTVVLPDYRPHGTPAAVQDRVERVFSRAFPGREIQFVDALMLNWLGGGLHCATLHEPLPG